MKKTLAIILSVLLFTLALTACGNSDSNIESPVQNDQITQNDKNSNNNSKNNTENDNDKKISDIKDPNDGTKLEVDLNKKGTVSDKNKNIDSDTIILNDSELTLPVKVSDFKKLGYELNDDGKNYEPNKTYLLASYDLYLNGKNSISLQKAINPTDTVCTIDSLEVHGFYLKSGLVTFYDSETDEPIVSDTENGLDFILPGGITKYSTANDVISILGQPKNNAHFKSVRVLDDQLNYEEPKSSGLSYRFVFNDNGSIDSIHIEMN